MNRSKTLNRLPALTFALAALVAAAAGGAGQDLAAVQVGPDGITWTPRSDGAGLMLTVSGGGRVIQSRFAAGEAPSLALVDATGAALPDGSYVWELRLAPETGKRRDTSGPQGGEPATGPRIAPQSGSFVVNGGSILDAGRTEGRPAAGGGGTPTVPNDFVIADDLIVQGSACIGLDCVNNENFSFDTIRLKENNLRIKFEDTSTIPGFPTGDWQLTANDSGSGGVDRFSIEEVSAGRVPFTVRGGARHNAMFIDSGGRVGLGTATPVLNLHVLSGNTPALRLDQDASSGFTPQVWDIAGNEVNFFVRDATAGSRLPFRITPGAASNSLFIGNTGAVGIHTSSPDPAVNLHVRAFTSSPARLRVEPTTAGQSSFLQLFTSNVNWQFQNNAVNGNFVFRDVTSTNSPFIIEAGTTQNVMTITKANQVVVKGVVVHPDYVFEPDYPLESIEEHAAYMWANKHLPAVGAGTYDEDGMPLIPLGDRSQGMLEELEKAHIYIEQLHVAAREKDARIARLEASSSEMSSRLALLEEHLAARPAVE